MSSWLDESVMLGAMTAVFVALGLAWAVFGLNRLWVAHLQRTAGDDFVATARALGLDPRAPTYAPRLWATGELDGQKLLLELRGGLSGEVVRLRLGRKVREAHFCELESATAWAQDALAALRAQSL